MSASLRVFTWPQLLIFFCLALVACSLGTLLSYNGPLTTPAWHDWANGVCSSGPGVNDGAAHAPIIDIIRAALALVLVVFGFNRLSIIPSQDDKNDKRRLNWLPVLLPSVSARLRRTPSLAFEASFAFEKWVLLAFLLLAIVVIAISRPLDLLGVWVLKGSTQYSLLAQIGLLYSTDFSNVTRPYLFPYSLYILGLWYCMALPVLLAIIRSIKSDRLEYTRLQSALEVKPIGSLTDIPQNIAGTYERKCLECFDFINTIGKRYALFLLGVFVICFIQETRLSCSVLTGATDTGKLLLLLLTVASLGAMLFAYLRLHYDARKAGQAGINTISDALEKVPSREPDLRRATEVAEVIRKRDGLAELNAVIRGAGLVGLILGLIWKYVLHGSLCSIAYAILPDALVAAAAKLLQLKCIAPH
jgi:hypothetical protein